MLIDPDYGYSQSFDALPAAPGLLLTLEDFAFEESPEGRKTFIMRDWSVEKIKRAGADGILTYFAIEAAKLLKAQR